MVELNFEEEKNLFVFHRGQTRIERVSFTVT